MAKDSLGSDLKSKILVDSDGTARWSLERLAADGSYYAGLFRFKCVLDPLQIIAADRDQRRLLGEHQAFASDVAANMAFMLSQLRQRVIESPPFWREGSEEYPGGRIKDYDTIVAVFDASVAAQELFQEDLRTKSAARAEKIRKALTEHSKAIKEEIKKEAQED
jgi:hypothetical protein